MFDKMIISDANAVESRGRSRYFIVSSLVVGALFVSAVVLSIYAVELDLGTEEFELSMMLAPVDSNEPVPPKATMNTDQTPVSRSDAPTRVHNIQRPEETPTTVPDGASVVKSPYLSRPFGPFDLGKVDSPEPSSPDGSGSSRIGNPDGRSSANDIPEPITETARIPDPPALKPNPPARPMTLGVVNGKATNLPKPPYPAAAIAINAQGEVTVQVTIDETGKVVSAKAAKGHPILKPAAERAAWQARFSPTLLSGVPVKVTGVIVYNFKRN